MLLQGQDVAHLVVGGTQSVARQVEKMTYALVCSHMLTYAHVCSRMVQVEELRRTRAPILVATPDRLLKLLQEETACEEEEAEPGPDKSAAPNTHV